MKNFHEKSFGRWLNINHSTPYTHSNLTRYGMPIEATLTWPLDEGWWGDKPRLVWYFLPWFGTEASWFIT